MKRALLFILLFLPMLASADAVEIGGIYYNLSEETREAVVTSNPQKYKGDVIIPESVEYEGITYSVTSVGTYAFFNCSDLVSITIPNSVTSIGLYAFSGCKELASVIIPNSVTSVNAHAFSFCEGLTSVTIGGGVTEILHYAFCGCTNLESVTIPNSVKNIGPSAFQDCSGLKTIVVENGNSVYDSREDCNAIIKTSENELLFGCMNTTIPNTVTSIGAIAFQNCSGLTSIIIPSSVTNIGTSAFSGCI